MKRYDLNIVLNKFGVQCYDFNKEKDGEYKLIQFLIYSIPLILNSYKTNIDYEPVLNNLTKIAKEAREEVAQEAIKTKKIINEML